MADLALLQKQIRETAGDLVQSASLKLGELTLEVVPAQLISLCQILKNNPDMAFDMLLDVCGVDYLHYGLEDWQTETATRTGFGRGVSAAWRAEVNPHFTQRMPTLEESSPVSAISHPIKKDPQASSETDALVDGLGDGSQRSLSSNETTPHRFTVVYHLLSLSHNHRIRIKVNIPDDQELMVDSVIAIWPSADWFERETFDLFGILFKGHPDLRRILTDYGFVGHPFRKDFPLIGKVEARYDATVKRVIYEPVSIAPRVLEPKVIRHDNRYKMPPNDEALSRKNAGDK